jgi:Iron-containing redox enzyme
MNRFSNCLRQELAALDERRAQLWAALANPAVFRRVYPDLLRQTYHYVKYSCPLMEEALSVLPAGSVAVRRYLGEHIPEERGHDVWLLKDLEALGYREATTRRTSPCPAVASLVGSQMYVTRERGGCSVLGYIYVLESGPTDYDRLSELLEAAAIPRAAAFAFLKHSRLDPDHADELRQVLDDSELTDADRDAITLSAQLATHNICSLAEQLAVLSLRVGAAPAPTRPAVASSR